MKVLYLKKIYDTLLSEGVVLLTNESWSIIKDDLFNLLGDFSLIVGFNEANPDIVRIELSESLTL